MSLAMHPLPAHFLLLALLPLGAFNPYNRNHLHWVAVLLLLLDVIHCAIGFCAKSPFTNKQHEVEQL
jgi:hypothetical protein